MINIAFEEQARAWRAVWDQCVRLGMNTSREESGLETVQTFIRELNQKNNQLQNVVDNFQPAPIQIVLDREASQRLTDHLIYG